MGPGGLSETVCGPRVRAEAGPGAAGGGALLGLPLRTLHARKASLPLGAVRRPHSFSWPVPQSVPSPVAEGALLLR